MKENTKFLVDKAENAIGAKFETEEVQGWIDQAKEFLNLARSYLEKL